jgi:hypothetical protein
VLFYRVHFLKERLVFVVFAYQCMKGNETRDIAMVSEGLVNRIALRNWREREDREREDREREDRERERKRERKRESKRGFG